MYDLDFILDEVRCTYYASKVLPRPTISWSDEYWTGIFGRYTLFDNHITISRLLNNEQVSYEALSSVVYHENLHQDFPEHDRKFNLRANKFPRYKDFGEKLNKYYSEIETIFENQAQPSDYGKNKKRAIYIVLPYKENFVDAFAFCNGNIHVDSTAKIESDGRDEVVIFLVDNGEKYHIVAWTNNAVLYKSKKEIKYHNFGWWDIQYQIIVPRNDMKILSKYTCSYAIEKSNFPTSINKQKYCTLDINDSGVGEDLKYINTYCEGFIDIGIDPAVVDVASPYTNVTYAKLSKIALEKQGFEGLWTANALCKIYNDFNAVFLRADALRCSGLISLAYEEMKKAYSISNNDEVCIVELIKLCAMMSDFEFGKTIITQIESIPLDDKCLKNSIAFINKNS